MRSLHLFAGAGGGLLADLILGHTPIAAVEINPYCCNVLRQRRDDGWFPGLRVHEQDIRLFDPSEYAGRVDLIAGGFPCQDISAAGKGAGITGERSGLWREFARIIGDVRPRFVFVENSPMLTLRGLDVVLGDLAALGMDAVWTVVSAADAGAPHRRERIWILAHANGLRLEEHELLQSDLSARSGEMANAASTGRPAGGTASGHGPHGQICDVQSSDGSRPVANANCFRLPGQSDRDARGLVAQIGGEAEAGDQPAISVTDSRPDVANANSLRQLQPQGRECDQRGWAGDGSCKTTNPYDEGLQRDERERQARKEGAPRRHTSECNWREPQSGVGLLADELSPQLVPGWWDTEPDVGRVATGVKNRVGKLKALGNAQVPIQAALAWRILSDAISR